MCLCKKTHFGRPETPPLPSVSLTLNPPHPTNTPTHIHQADPDFHAKLKELSKAFLLAERALPVLPIKPKEGTPQEEEAKAKAKEETKEGEEGEGEKTVKFIGPGA